MALDRGSSSNIILLCIFLVLFAIPCFAKGAGKVDTEGMDPGVYEIDYRGPETHTYKLPPPNKGRARAHSKSKDLVVSGRKARASARKIHG